MEIHFSFLNWTKNRSVKLMFDYRIPNSFYRIQMRGFPVAKIIKQRSKYENGFQFKIFKFWGFFLQRQGTLNPLLLPVDQKGRNHFRKIVSAKYFCFLTFAAKEKQNERALAKIFRLHLSSSLYNCNYTFASKCFHTISCNLSNIAKLFFHQKT